MKQPVSKPKIVVILGPTASGKSDLAVQLAQKFNGEVISADSRQVYTGLTLGTGKITKKEMQGIPHHLLDVVNPKKRFTVAEYKKLADTAIADISARGKLPILCGGTGFYIQAVVDNVTLPEVPPNVKLRAELAKKSPQQLLTQLQKLDARRAHAIDPHNIQRVIRAIEIATALGKVPKIKTKPQYEVLQIGIETELEVLKTKIETRLHTRIKKGMIAEAKNLHTQGVSWKRMHELGLEYRFLALHLQKKLSKQELINQLTIAIGQYVKQQLTWFKRDPRIIWLPLSKQKQIEKHIRTFIGKMK